jgi:hypothetical protein
MMKLWKVYVVVTCLLLIASGCTPVKPWQKATLAKPEMAWEPLPMVSAMDSHVYFSKEGSNGGLNSAGGGCGCN